MSIQVLVVHPVAIVNPSACPSLETAFPFKVNNRPSATCILNLYLALFCVVKKHEINIILKNANQKITFSQVLIFMGILLCFVLFFEGFSSQVENKISAYRLSDAKVPSAQTCKKASYTRKIIYKIFFNTASWCNEKIF